MLRSIIPILALSLCAMASAQQEATDEAAAAAVEPTREARAEKPAEEQDQSKDKTVSTVEAGSGNFRYTVKFKRVVAEREGIQCSHGRKTGSHKRKTYCRPDAVAQAEADAAREFFLAAMRNKN